jgi:alkyl sulfatase BDS1-like metallo-beta-lactamase superfamily hydrolase
MTPYDFIEGEAPDTVHPGLWRQARLNNLHGLYEVTDGIYQVRGYDLSNISFIRGETGWIVIDPLISAEPARAALDFINRRTRRTAGDGGDLHAQPRRSLRRRPRRGRRGRRRAGGVRIVAPEGFMHHAISENVLAGNAMSRRASYMFGRTLPPARDAQVDTGLGGRPPGHRDAHSADGHHQRDGHAHDPRRRRVRVPEHAGRRGAGGDDVLHAEFKALCVAEEANATLHNLYTLRGAQVRSGKLWAQWLDEAILLFGDDLELVFGSHHWPRWGRDEAIEFLEKQRDLYKYIHDQTLRLANQGLTSREIAETIELPEALALPWYNRGFYGSVRHNAKATYQLYLGWYDGNPANLDPHPPTRRLGATSSSWAAPRRC